MSCQLDSPRRLPQISVSTELFSAMSKRPDSSSIALDVGLVALLAVPLGVSAQDVQSTFVSPTRRIEIQQDFQPYPLPSSPFVVRATSQATGAAKGGERVFVGTGIDFSYPHIYDKFGFRGFNTIDGPISYDNMGGSAAQYFAVTDANGLAELNGRYFDPAPSAFIVATAIDARPWVPTTWKYVSVVAVRNTPAGRPSVVVEYFNADNGHYFITISPLEIDALDSGRFAGWTRSPGAFIAYETQADAPQGAVPVCRFFSEKYTSHFYTADPAECDSVGRKPSNVWTLETKSAFYIEVPDKGSGDCASGLQPIHRMFNNNASPNHRYVADARLRDMMTGAGWIAEGYGGAKAVMMCTPS